MLTEERYAAIIERLHLQGIVKLQELVDVWVLLNQRLGVT